jgi:hypothetical protein
MTRNVVQPADPQAALKVRQGRAPAEEVDRFGGESEARTKCGRSWIRVRLAPRPGRGCWGWYWYWYNDKLELLPLWATSTSTSAVAATAANRKQTNKQGNKQTNKPSSHLTRGQISTQGLHRLPSLLAPSLGSPWLTRQGLI